MATTVTMLQTRRGEDGTLWTAGSQYCASDDFAAFLITANVATGTLPSLGGSAPLRPRYDALGNLAGAVDAAGNVALFPGGASLRSAVAVRTGMPNLYQANLGTAGLTGKGSLCYGNCGLKTVPITTPGSGMTPGTYPLSVSGGTPTTAATGTYTVDSTGVCASTSITFPGIGYNTAPTVSPGGSPGGTPPTFTPTIGATANEYFQQSSYLITEDCWDLLLHLGNFLPNNSAPGQTDNGPSTLTRRIGVRLGGVATAVPVYSPNGSRDIVLEPGADVFVTVPGPYYKGQTLWIQEKGVYASAPAAWPLAKYAYQSNGSEVCEFGTNLTDNTLATAAVGGLVHASNFAINPPIAITALRKSTVATPVSVIFGDSIGSDGSNDAGGTAYTGFVSRSFATGSYALLNLGATGYGINAFMATAAASRQARWRKYRALKDAGVKHAFTNWVTNDISGSATDPTATVVSKLTALRDELLVFGIRLIPMTCCPRTNTSNNAVNSADTASGWTWVTNVNAAIRAAFPIHYDLNAFMRDPANPNIWDTTRNPSTVDGIHPSTADHVACANDSVAGSFAAALPGFLGS